MRTVPIFDLDLHLVHRPLWTKALPSVSQSFTSCEERPARRRGASFGARVRREIIRGPVCKARSTTQNRTAIAGRDDVGLHGIVRRVGRVALEHRALVESADRAGAVVAADAKDDRALPEGRRAGAERAQRRGAEGGRRGAG